MPVMSKLTFNSREGEPLQWREVYWSGGTEVESALQAWQGVEQGNSLLGLRASFLTNSARITALSCTALNPPAAKITRVLKLFPPMVGREASADYCGLGVSLQLTSQGKRRNLSLRGIADVWVSGNELSEEGNAGVQRILAGVVGQGGKQAGRQPGFVQALITRLGVGIYGLNVADTYPFTAVTKAASGLLRLSMAADALAIITVGSVVTVTQVPSMPLLRGQWKVAAKDADIGYIELAGSQALAHIAGTTGRVRPAGKAMYSVDIQASVVGLRTRDTGRPTNGPRGRRSARLRRR